jgi:hypothetical protein
LRLTFPTLIAFAAAGIIRVVFALLLRGLLRIALLGLVAVLLVLLAGLLLPFLGLLLPFLGLLLHLGLPFLDALLPLLAFQLQAFGFLGIGQAFILSILVLFEFILQRLAALLLLLRAIGQPLLASVAPCFSAR